MSLCRFFLSYIFAAPSILLVTSLGIASVPFFSMLISAPDA